MNIISFLMPTTKSGDAGAKSQAPADVQTGTGFAAMLAQVLGSLGVPVRAAPTAGPAATLETELPTEAGDDIADDGAVTTPVPASGESVGVEATGEGGLDVLLTRRTPDRVLDVMAGDEAADAAMVEGGETSQASAAASNSVAVVGADRVVPAAFDDIRRTQPQPISSAESGTAARMPADGALPRDAGDHGHANTDRVSLGEAVRQPDRTAADPRRMVAGPAQQIVANDAIHTPSAVRYDAPSAASPVLLDHVIESVTSAQSDDIASVKAVPATQHAAEKLMDAAKQIDGRQTLSAPQKEALAVAAERVNADPRAIEPDAEAAAPARSEMTAPRIGLMAELPVPRMMNSPSGNGEAAMAREAPDLPQQAEAQKGAFDSVSLRVNNADGTPTRIRVAVRGDEVRTAIIENDAGTAQRMATRGDELQQSLAARGFSKTTLSVHMPMGRAPDIAVAQPMHMDRSDAGSSSDGRADRDGERASQRDQMHDRPDTDRERSRQRSRQERER